MLILPILSIINMINSKNIEEVVGYIGKFKGDTFIVKFSGKVVEDDTILESVAKDIAILHKAGINLIIVHGAGRMISDTLDKFGLKTTFINGERVTKTRETLDIVIGCLYCVNNKLVGTLNKHDVKAVGLTSSLLLADKTKRKGLGFVGDIKEVKKELLDILIDKTYIPVIFPIGIDRKTTTPLNINADIVAGEIAHTAGAKKFIVLTSVKGVLDENGDLIKQLSIKECKELKEKGIIESGMIPKVNACILALEKGVEKSHIVGAKEDALLGELLTDEGTGTMIIK